MDLQLFAAEGVTCSSPPHEYMGRPWLFVGFRRQQIVPGEFAGSVVDGNAELVVPLEPGRSVFVPWQKTRVTLKAISPTDHLARGFLAARSLTGAASTEEGSISGAFEARICRAGGSAPPH